MLKRVHPKDFSAAGATVAHVKRKCLERNIVKKTPGATEALNSFFHDPAISPNQKKVLSTALNGFALWMESARPDTSILGAITSADIQAYLDTIANNEKRIEYRGSLRRAFDILAKHSILPADHNLVPHLLPGPKTDNTLPFIARNSGAAIVTAIEGFFREKYPDFEDRKHKPHLYALRGLEKWAATVGLPSLTAMNARDGTAYLNSIENRETSYGHAYLLRELFEYLLAKGEVKANPFLYADANPERLDEKLANILQLARKTGGGAEALLRKFLDQKSVLRKSFFHHSSALDHFALWLVRLRRIENLRLVDRDILLHYRQEVMPKEYTAGSVRSMASCINQFFIFLSQQGFFEKTDPAYSIGLRKSMPLARVKTRLSVVRVIRRAVRQKRMTLSPVVRHGFADRHDFANLTLDGLSYSDRLSAATFIDYISRCRFRTGQFQAGCILMTANYPLGNVTLSDRIWAEAARLGMVEMNEGVRIMGASFVSRFKKDGLKKWAHDFTLRHREAGQLRHAEQTALPQRRPRRPRKDNQASVARKKECAA